MYGVASPAAKTLNIASTGVEHVVSRRDVFHLCNGWRGRLLTENCLDIKKNTPLLKMLDLITIDVCFQELSKYSHSTCQSTLGPWTTNRFAEKCFVKTNRTAVRHLSCRVWFERSISLLSITITCLLVFLPETSVTRYIGYIRRHKCSIIWVTWNVKIVAYH